MFTTELVGASTVETEVEMVEQGGLATEVVTTDMCVWDSSESSNNTHVFGNKSEGGLQAR